MKKLIVVLFLIGFVIGMRYLGYISFESSSCNTSTVGMMGSSRGNMMFGGMIMWVIIIIVVIGLFSFSDNSNNKKKSKHIEKLDERLVNGDISIEEYNEIKNKLGN